MDTGKNDKKALIKYIGAMLIFGTIGVFRRYVNMPSAFISCFRGFSGGIFLIIVVLFTKKKISAGATWKQIVFLIIIGFMIGFNWLFLFEAFNYTTVATATLCYYMQPTIIIAASPFVFGEKLSSDKKICAAIAIAGMVLVSGIIESGMPAFGEFKGILYGLAAAGLYAVIVILNKKYIHVDAYLKTIIQLISAAVVMVPYTIIFTDMSVAEFNIRGVIMLVILGIFHTGIAFLWYFGSFDRIRSQSLAILAYIDPIAALVLSTVILREKLSILGIIGAVMILGATIVSELNNDHNALP